MGCKYRVMDKCKARDNIENAFFFFNDGCPYYEKENAPTVEAIPKDQYEQRLKADLAAMLTDLHLKMEELGDDLNPTEDWDYGYKSGVEDMIQLLDERIDKLKGESDAQEQKKE